MRIVDSPHVKRLRPLLGNAAYLALASGFVMTDILSLRLMLVGGYTALTCFHLLHANPLRIPLRWSALFVAVNTAMVARIVMERWPSGLTEEDESLRLAFFDRLTPAQFVRVLKLGERRELSQGSVLTVEREQCGYLYFVEQGLAEIGVNGERVATVGRGGFVNDVAFQQGEGAGSYGTVTASTGVTVIAWEQATLREALLSDEKLASSMTTVLTTRLVEQLLQRYKAEEQQQQRQVHRTTSGQMKAVRLRTRETGDAFRDSFERARSRAAAVVSQSAPTAGYIKDSSGHPLQPHEQPKA